jgi:hypothetical protein
METRDVEYMLFRGSYQRAKTLEKKPRFCRCGNIFTGVSKAHEYQARR